jgi:hypothetical protein
MISFRIVTAVWKIRAFKLNYLTNVNGSAHWFTFNNKLIHFPHMIFHLHFVTYSRLTFYSTELRLILKIQMQFKI